MVPLPKTADCEEIDVQITFYRLAGGWVSSGLPLREKVLSYTARAVVVWRPRGSVKQIQLFNTWSF